MGSGAPSSTSAASSEIAAISAKIMIATIIVVFLLMLLLFCVHIYAKCYWTPSEDPTIVSWRRREARRARPAATDSHRRGLDPLALRSIPIVRYNSKEFKDGLECAVCLSELSDGEEVRILPKCNHGFHVDCIDMWFHSHATCPLCRNPVIPTKNPSKKPNSSDNGGVDLPQISSSHRNSSSSSDDDDDEYYVTAPNLPANVLFWGNETQVRGVGDATSSTPASSSGVNTSMGELVIEIPRESFEDCSSSPLPQSSGIWSVSEEEVKSPVMTRLRSLKRLLSRGKRVAPSNQDSTSGDSEQV